MATKSSIHIKPCNIASSEAHNRRTAEYMRNIGKSRIYVIPELSTDNEQWINPDFGSPDLRTHYDNIRQMVKEKTGRAMQEKERERKGKNGKIIKVAGCSPIREGVLLVRSDTTLADVQKFGEECQRRWGNHTAANLPSQRRGTLAERSAGSGRQGKFSGWEQMVQAELSCPHRFRLDEPRNRKEPQAQ